MEQAKKFQKRLRLDQCKRYCRQAGATTKKGLTPVRATHKEHKSLLWCTVITGVRTCTKCIIYLFRQPTNAFVVGVCNQAISQPWIRTAPWKIDECL